MVDLEAVRQRNRNRREISWKPGDPPPVEAVRRAVRQPDGSYVTPVAFDATHHACEDVEALLEEVERLRAMVKDAVKCIEGLADQQAMPDDWYKPILERLKGGSGG